MDPINDRFLSKISQPQKKIMRKKYAAEEKQPKYRMNIDIRSSSKIGDSTQKVKYSRPTKKLAKKQRTIQVLDEMDQISRLDVEVELDVKSPNQGSRNPIQHSNMDTILQNSVSRHDGSYLKSGSSVQYKHIDQGTVMSVHQLNTPHLPPKRHFVNRNPQYLMSSFNR